MTTTRQSAAVRVMERRERQARHSAGWRLFETALLLISSLLVAWGLWIVYAAKTREFADAPKLIDLNTLTSPTQLFPALSFATTSEEREFIARKIYAMRGKHLANAGAAAGIRVTEKEAASRTGLDSLRKRLKDAAAREKIRAERKRNWFSSPEPRPAAVPLLTGEQIRALKPAIAVRSPADFHRTFLIWVSLYFFTFYVVHGVWRWKGFAGDHYVLPLLHLLSGAGLILMVSLRDPLRDTLMFQDFAQGAIIGCLLLLVCSLRDYEREFRDLAYLWLGLALVLALALGVLGTGPGESDAKVNLFFFQPMEAIRIFLVLFLAGYFARNWDALRDLKQRGGGLLARFSIPRLEYVLPVVIGVATALLMFFLLKDLGPALVIGGLFLVMFSVARKRAGAALAGLCAVVFVFWLAHAAGYPETVTQRIDMRNSPWDNTVRGGDQLAHSLWALSSGGVFGAGAGLGSPDTIPAGHTDLIVSALGEEWGLVGVLGVYLLYGLLLWRCVLTALRAQGVYSFFLVLGLATVTALQIVLITGGILGVLPLSGVVSPFLSYGRTSMAANFALFGIILSVSARAKAGQAARFGVPMAWVGYVFGFVFTGLMARAAFIQTKQADDLAARAALVVQSSGPRQYEYNPRLTRLARSIPKGEISDRNGLPLASSTWGKIEAHRKEYAALGVPLPTSAPNQRRFYPLGPKMFYLVGDVTSTRKRGAPNTAFQERASRIRLQGFDDYSELEISKDPGTGNTVRRIKYDYRDLVPLLRHRNEPGSPEMKDVMDRNRDVRMSIDARFQMRASAILEAELHKLGKDKGSLVVLDPDTGDLLAAVSYPWPAPSEFAALSGGASGEAPGDVNDDELQDRARYGLYPPGSSFKIVTAIAALRKDPALARQVYGCIRLPDGRSGNFVGKSKRPIRDDVMDKSPHGSVDMGKGIAVSCNAYFAQLGAYNVGAKGLFDTAGIYGISTASPNKAEKLREALPQASYGQGQVVVSPFQMARVAASVANGGRVLQGRWVIDDSNARLKDAVLILPPDQARQLGGFMRRVVTEGTGRSLGNSAVPIAGKTGTAELANALSHAWFVGYAPYGGPAGKRIAFSVLVENGQYGGTAAAPVAGELVAAARELGII